MKLSEEGRQLRGKLWRLNQVDLCKVRKLPETAGFYKSSGLKILKDAKDDLSHSPPFQGRAALEYPLSFEEWVALKGIQQPQQSITSGLKPVASASAASFSGEIFKAFPPRLVQGLPSEPPSSIPTLIDRISALNGSGNEAALGACREAH